MNDNWSAELISAYLDGELSSEQRRRVEEYLEQNSGAAQELRELQAIRGELQSLPRYALKRDFAQRVLQAASAGNQAAGAGTAAPPVRWRAAGLAIAALAATLVFTIVYVPQSFSPAPDVAAMNDDRAIPPTDERGAPFASRPSGSSGQQDAAAAIVSKDGATLGMEAASLAMDKNAGDETVNGNRPTADGQFKGGEPSVAQQTAQPADPLAQGVQAQALEEKRAQLAMPGEAKTAAGGATDLELRTREELKNASPKLADRANPAPNESLERRGADAPNAGPPPAIEPQAQLAQLPFTTDAVLVDQLIIVETDQLDAEKIDQALQANNIQLDQSQMAPQFYRSAGRVPGGDQARKTELARAPSIDALWISATEQQIDNTINQFNGRRVLAVPMQSAELSDQLIQQLGNQRRLLEQADNSADTRQRGVNPLADSDDDARANELEHRPSYALRLSHELNVKSVEADQFGGFAWRDRAARGIRTPDGPATLTQSGAQTAPPARADNGLAGAGGAALPTGETERDVANTRGKQQDPQQRESELASSAGEKLPLPWAEYFFAEGQPDESQLVRRYLLLIYPLNPADQAEAATEVAPASKK